MTAVSFSEEGPIGRITLDDGKVNAIDPHWLAAFCGCLDLAETRGVRGLILQGGPPTFSAGLDVKVLPQLPLPARREFLRAFGRAVLRLFVHPCPVIAALGGHALAGGAVLALAADHRMAARGSSKLGLPATSLGVALPSFALEVARSQLPPHAHMRCLAFGDTFGPDEARELGFVHELVLAHHLSAAAQTRAHALAQLPRDAFVRTKRAVRAEVLAAAARREEDDLDFLLASGPFSEPIVQNATS